MNAFEKNFRGFFSQSSLNTATEAVGALAVAAQSGDLQVSANAQRNLQSATMMLGLLHMLVNMFPHAVTLDVPPHPAAPQVLPDVAAEHGLSPAPVVAPVNLTPAPIEAAPTPVPPVAPAPAPIDAAPAPAPAAEVTQPGPAPFASIPADLAGLV